MPKEILCAFSIHCDAVAGWLGSYKGEDSPGDISRGVFAAEVGVADLIERVPTDLWTETVDYADNPLGKIPTLIGPDGSFVNSLMCCEYLDTLHAGRRLIPVAPDARWPVLRLHGLADGIAEAAVAHVIESLRRPADHVYAGFLQRQRDRIERTLDAIEVVAPATRDGVDLGTIALGCTLAYLDFRLPDLDWRRTRPVLARWEAGFAARPAMVTTVPRL